MKRRLFNVYKSGDITVASFWRMDDHHRVSHHGTYHPSEANVMRFAELANDYAQSGEGHIRVWENGTVGWELVVPTWEVAE